MALIECPDCGRPVSTNARSCPNCGCVVNSSAFAKFVVVFLAAVAVVAYFEWKGKAQEEPAKAALAPPAKAEEPAKKRPAVQKKEAPAKKKSGDGVQRAVLGAKALKKSIPNAEGSQLQAARVVDTGAVCYEYRTVNGFGGYNTGKAVLPADGKLVSTEMSGFAAVWQSECTRTPGTDVLSSINWFEF